MRSRVNPETVSDTRQLNVLDLFSGIGGFSLGLHRAGMKTVAFCEVDEFCQKVLSRNFPGIPIHGDIKNLKKENISERVDLICGGFPCQPFSIAGSKKSQKDHRDLWPEMFRVIEEFRPTWVIGENVANFINLAFTRTKVNLESIGYTVQPFTIPACSVDAQHRRDRVWIVAHFDGDRLEQKTNAKKKKDFEGFRKSDWWTNGPASIGRGWTNRSNMGRAVYDVSRGLDEHREQRIKALGNAVVPVIPEIIGRAIMDIEGAHK